MNMFDRALAETARLIYWAVRLVMFGFCLFVGFFIGHVFGAWWFNLDLLVWLVTGIGMWIGYVFYRAWVYDLEQDVRARDNLASRGPDY